MVFCRLARLMLRARLSEKIQRWIEVVKQVTIHPAARRPVVRLPDAVVAAALEVAQKRDRGRSDDRPTLADVQVLVRDHVAKAAAIDQRVQHLERYLLGAGHQLVPASFASQHDADFPILSTKLVQN